MFLNNVPLKFTSSIKYLGVFISHDLSDDHDMERHKKYLYCKGNLIVTRFRHCSENVKVKLFKTYCYSTFGAQLWTRYKPESLRKTKVAFNDVFRHLFGFKRDVSVSQHYVNLTLDCFQSLLRHVYYSFRSRLLQSDNRL